MEPFHRVRSFEERPEGYLEDGHFWLREFVTGGSFLVRMADSGLLVFRGPERDFDESVPWPFRPAVSSLRSELDRDRFREAVDYVSNYTFSVFAPLSMGVEYDWDQTPAVIGRAIWDDTEEAYVPIDVTERVFEELGVATLPTIEREVPARDLASGPGQIPTSAFGTTQAAGIEMQKKRGETVAVLQDGLSGLSRVPPEPAGQPPDVEAWMEERLDRDAVQIYTGVEESMASSDVDTLVEAVGGEVARRHFDEIGGLALDHPQRFESAVRTRLVDLRSDSVGADR